VPELERRLIRDAATGDQFAFEQLLAGAKARIHGVVSNFLDAPGAEREVMYSIAIESAWRSCKSGRLNPEIDWFAQISRPIRHKLITECERLRAECRWNGQYPLDVDDLPDGHEFGSWATMGVDPIRVVLGKEELRRCWALTSETQRAAIQRWLDGATDKRTGDAITEVRRRAKPMLADPYGASKYLNRTCAHCHQPLTGDVRRKTHPACKRAHHWTLELALHTVRRPAAIPLRLA